MAPSSAQGFADIVFRQIFNDRLSLNQALAIAYYLQEDLAQIWQQRDKATTDRFLTDWCASARASGIQVPQTMANTLEKHRIGILNWYDFQIATGPLEGINNKIGALQRMCCARDLSLNPNTTT